MGDPGELIRKYMEVDSHSRRGGGNARSTRRIVVSSSNFGGSGRAIAPPVPLFSNRPQALADFIVNADGEHAHIQRTLPFVACCQEMTRILDPPEDHWGDLLAALREADHTGLSSYYLATVDTVRYPRPEVAGRLWQAGLRHVEQGMATVAGRGAFLLDPSELEGGRRRDSAGANIPLPVVALSDEDVAPKPGGPASDDVSLSVMLDRIDPSSFTAADYVGNRDTEPRVATTHAIRLGDRVGLPEACLVLVNVHLTTLNVEDRGRVGLKHEQSRTQVACRLRQPTEAAQLVRGLQLREISRIIEWVYARLRLPVVVAGDFNASADSEELLWFMKRTKLAPVFREGSCWGCRHEHSDADIRTEYFTGDRFRTVLTSTPEEYHRITGDGAKSIFVSESCPQCGLPQFTHRRNLGLIDNILYTDSVQYPGLRFRLRPTGQGIRLDTFFSDHSPIWAEFEIIEDR